MRSIRTGPRQFYNGRFFIVFYDKTDEEFLYMFDNVREILQFQKQPITRQNVNLINVQLYRALRSEHHFTRLLTGEVMRVYTINIDKDDDL